MFSFEERDEACKQMALYWGGGLRAIRWQRLAKFLGNNVVYNFTSTMMKRQQILIPAFVAIAGLFAACKKNDAQKPNLDATRHALYNQYKDGEIDECLYNGDTVYCAGHNGYDAGAYIYDGFGKQIATCNYAWGLVDAICKQLQSCTVIYRCKNHVTQLPFADVYGLSK